MAFHVLRYYGVENGKSKLTSPKISTQSRPQADRAGTRGAPLLSLRLPHGADLWPLDPTLYPLLRRQDPPEQARGPGCGALSLPPGHGGSGVGLHPAAGPECPGVSLPGCLAHAP